MSHLGAERAGALLDDEQPVGDRSAGADQQADRARRSCATRPAAGRAAREERRRRANRPGARSGSRWTSTSAFASSRSRRVAAMGLPLEVTVVGRRRQHPRRDLGRRAARCCSGARARRSTRCSRSSTPRSAASSRTIASFVVDCMDYRKAQGRRAAADGALHDGEGEDRRAAGDGAAQSRTPAASSTSRSPKIRRCRRRASATRS